MSVKSQAVTGDAVLRVICAQLDAEFCGALATPETDLWQAGMDSLSSVSVMIAVEESFDIEFPDRFLTREVFSSARNIAAAVRQLVTDEETQ